MSETLTATAGRPFAQEIRVVDAKNVWPTADLCEVRAQLRQGKTTKTPLIANLHDHMTWDISGNDLVITWKYDGHEVRNLLNLTTWGRQTKGFCNIIVSDIGTEDENAVVVPVFIFKVVDTTTSEAGST